MTEIIIIVFIVIFWIGWERRGYHFESGPSLYSGFSLDKSANPLKNIFQIIGEEPDWITYDRWGILLLLLLSILLLLLFPIIVIITFLLIIIIKIKTKIILVIIK